MPCREVTGLYFMPPNTTINGPNYTKLFKEKQKLHMHINGYKIFIQDGAPCHRSKVATEFLKENTISVLEQPRNIPDINPFENMWTIMKMAYKQPSSAENLMQAIKEVWVTEITQEYCESQVYSMPLSIQTVIDSNGEHTKY